MNPVSFSSPHPGTVHITHPTRSALLADIADRFEAGQGFTLATLNLDHIVKLRQESAFLAAYLVHNYVVADGNPIVWLSKIAGRRVELIPGSELITPLAEMGARMNVPVACVGSTQDTLDQAVAQLKKTYPALRIVAQIAPPFGLDVNGSAADRIIAKLEQCGARLCFLALGAPKQEILAVRAATVLPSCGFVSIGAGLDFIAGSQIRAPHLIRQLALEWAWRMANDPYRLARRYATCAAILPGLVREARRQGSLKRPQR